MVRALILVTSANEMNGHKTGYWLEEVAAPYYEFVNKGYEVDIASVAGGEPPVDSASTAESSSTPEGTAFLADAVAQEKIKHSIKVDDAFKDGRKYDVIFAAGGHGTCVDFRSAAVKATLEKMYQSGGIVAAVCHGPVALIDLTDSDGTTSLIANKNVTGFTNEEEAAVQLTDKVPFLLENELIARGAKMSKAGVFESYAVVDGRLVTGQNPQSSKLTAQKCIEILSAAA